MSRGVAEVGRGRIAGVQERQGRASMESAGSGEEGGCNVETTQG